MLTIHFVDEGQDFLEWDINEKGVVTACRPFQSWVWVGVKIQNKDIKRGDLITYTKDGARHQLIHPVEKVLHLELADKGKLRKGQVVTIYEDPITQTKPEGKAQLMELINQLVPDAMERWLVQFLDDDFHNPVERTINTKGGI